MFGSRLDGLIRHLRGVTDAGAEGVADGELLRRFVSQRDESAFTALLSRHGPMVLGVCRRVLGDAHDAEDAFQATFLVLVHKAGSIGRPQALGSWLYRTALRTALRARAQRGRRRARESVLDDPPAPEGVEDLAWHELQPVLDEEVNRLPRKYRDAVVSCYLQEKTYPEAARSLGLAAGTVSSRLARARDMLRKRLLRRGLALSSSLLVALLSQRALQAALPGALRGATTRAVLRLTAGQTVLAAAATESVATLAEGVLKAMFLTKLKVATVTVLMLAAVCAGSAVLLYASPGGDGRRTLEEKGVAKAQPPEGRNNPKVPADPGARWLKAAQRPGLPPRERAAYQQFARLHQGAYKQLTNWGTLLVPPDPADPLNVLSRMGLDVLPKLAEALDDITPTRTETTDGSGRKKEWRVNDLVARLIVNIAERDFTIAKQPGTFPPDLRDLDLIGIRELNTQPGAPAGFKKAVLDWYASNRGRSLAERKIADLGDPWNYIDAVRWLAEHKSAAGRRAIEKRVDAVLAELRQQKRIHTGMWAEIAFCGEALGKIGDKASLPKVREICRYLSDYEVQNWATGSAGPNAQTFYEAFHGLALLGEKEEAVRGLQAMYDRYRARYRVDRQGEHEDFVARARKW
jgi:RNA polymerase sigma factor (sigma-70 family)